MLILIAHHDVVIWYYIAFGIINHFQRPSLRCCQTIVCLKMDRPTDSSCHCPPPDIRRNDGYDNPPCVGLWGDFLAISGTSNHSESKIHNSKKASCWLCIYTAVTSHNFTIITALNESLTVHYVDDRWSIDDSDHGRRGIDMYCHLIFRVLIAPHFLLCRWLSLLWYSFAMYLSSPTHTTLAPQAFVASSA